MITKFANAVKYISYGVSTSSRGMEVVTFSPDDISVERVKSLEGFFLHPTIEPNSKEIFALKGTKKQFDLFYKDEVQSFCFNRSVEAYGLGNDDEDINRARQDMILERVQSFKPWYDNLHSSESSRCTGRASGN